MNFKITLIGRMKRKEWDCFGWQIQIGSETFKYYTGMGHVSKSGSPKKPKLRDVLWALVTDAEAAQGTFYDFCSDCGYDSDSRKALEIYLKCQESGLKLRRVMRSKNYTERILSWEL